MRSLICVEERDWERVIRGAARYLKGGEVILAHTIDERASRGYDLSMLGLLGRRPRSPEEIAHAAKTAAEGLLSSAGSLLDELCPDITTEMLVLQGIPEQELVRVVREREVGVVFVGRGAQESGAPATVSGVLREWRWNRPGDLDGFYLEDGTEVRFPPHRAREVQSVARQGMQVAATGEWHGRHLHAHVVQDPSSGASTEAHKPPGHGPRKHHLGHTARFVTDHVGCDVVILV